ncbi:nickel pincer cofactor biosynthesis protein LarC [Methanofollis formosanus]|uniref:Nickel pincer cofactor biosynthesis protein LarC n=1 Tax=Methanofollis formosanus TaxID=299308 RepID=A0A8G1EFP4_9EURY|nr:nickel pincer cofactor biosynthesis protein LarC [Methanofollis formosanus]QYZ78988.1 nickel pincer cofactor biosynthesis protein LarC [Methanofollis formosanus]
MKTLLIDPRVGGIAGDMLVAALVDLTGSTEPLFTLAGAIAALPGCSTFDVSVTETENGIRAKRLSIEIAEERSGSDGDLAAAMEEVIGAVGLSSRAAATARAVLTDLIEAEKRLHPAGFSRHTVASADTIFDILGPLLLMEEAGLLGCPVYATPPALGGGTVPTGRGEVGGPAPAALEICAMHRIPIAESALAMELTTPTGAALLANLAIVRDRFPAMVPTRIGYGAGTRENNGRPNLLRIVEGEVGDLVEERIVILETNLDDITGETVGYTFERLFAAGAVDVFVTPAIGKKQRPVQVLSVITDHARYPDLIRILMDETGTLGVRVREEPRLVADRSREAVEVAVAGQTFRVRVKTSCTGGRVVAVKPEYEDMKEIALTLGIPFRQVAGEVHRQIPAVRNE